MRPANPIARIILVRTGQASLLALLAHWTFAWPLIGPFALGLFLTPVLCAYFLFVFVAPWSWGLPILTRLRTPEKVVALTFDDGPSPETTPQVLDILREHHCPATFFVLGAAVARSPELLCRIQAEGHTVGAHGYEHQPFVLLGPRQLNTELQRTRDAIAHACPQAISPCWLRFPHGFKSLSALATALRAGWRLAAWSLDSRDYRDQHPAMVARTVLDRVRPGAIVLLHDGPANAVTVAALPLILAGLRQAGYRCVLLPEA